MKNSFTKLKHAIELREKLLLRQIDVLNRAPDNNKIDFGEISFQTQDEEKALELLRNYGAFQNIDCYLPYLENENEEMGLLCEKSFYDMNSMDNKKLSESIINLTLRESQNLITRSSDLVTAISDKLTVTSVSSKLKVDPPKVQRTIDKSLNLHDNELESIKQKNDVKVAADESKLRRNDTTTSSKKKTLKNISNLTLNNCNGSIVLKNISNLTINTCKQPEIKATEGKPIKTCATSKSCEGSFYQCDFYERLISENEVLKRSIVNQSLCTTFPDPIATACMSPPPSLTTGNKEQEPEDGTYSIISTAGESSVSSITDEADDGLAKSKANKTTESAIEEITTKTMLPDNIMSHPPMIQCWLNKMLLETETEAQNFSEFLEISNII